MRAISLAYHDVVDESNGDSSGFRSRTATRYKLSWSQFERHLGAIDQAKRPPRNTTDGLWDVQSASTIPLFLTFDDGGSSALRIAEALTRLGWRGHFLIPAAHVAKPGFLDDDGVRAIDALGHVIGSHSMSHPDRISACTWQQLLCEWTESVEVLSNILGKRVDVGSVPGGYYSRRVGQAASSAGLRVLFTSEPVTSIHQVGGCLILGRYMIVRSTSERTVAGLVSGDFAPRARQYLAWNAKKVPKAALGSYYKKLRAAL